jgi:hypothetical protein
MAVLQEFMKHSFDHLEWTTQQNFNIWFSGINHHFLWGFYLIKIEADIIVQIVDIMLYF